MISKYMEHLLLLRMIHKVFIPAFIRPDAIEKLVDDIDPIFD
jgi:hypothetical protein